MDVLVTWKPAREWHDERRARVMPGSYSVTFDLETEPDLLFDVGQALCAEWDRQRGRLIDIGGLIDPAVPLDRLLSLPWLIGERCWAALCALADENAETEVTVCLSDAEIDALLPRWRQMIRLGTARGLVQGMTPGSKLLKAQARSVVEDNPEFYDSLAEALGLRKPADS